jgi:hypothetical protein
MNSARSVLQSYLLTLARELIRRQRKRPVEGVCGLFSGPLSDSVPEGVSAYPLLNGRDPKGLLTAGESLRDGVSLAARPGRRPRPSLK